MTGDVLRKVQRGEISRRRGRSTPTVPRGPGSDLPQGDGAAAGATATPRRAALADDVEHWLADEPVTARSRSMQAWCWARRHRAAAATSAALIAAAFVGLVAGTGLGPAPIREIRGGGGRAQRQHDEARNLLADLRGHVRGKSNRTGSWSESS